MPLPEHPALAPGAVVVRRDDAWLEVRLGQHRVVVLPDRPEVREVLDHLREHRRPTRAVHAWVLERLLAHRLLVDAVLLADADPANPSPVTAEAVAARGGLEAAARLARRRAARIEVWAAPGLEALAESAREALARAGLTPGQPEAHDAADPSPTLLISTPGAAADHAAPWVAAGAEHLAVLVEPDGCLIGPYVHPGLTACLHCVVAHRTDRDPRWPLTAAQTTRLQAAQVNPDPALLHQAWAFAALDLCRAVEGDLPLTWSSSHPVRMDPAAITDAETDPQAVVRWLRHPACGCAWDSWDVAG